MTNNAINVQRNMKRASASFISVTRTWVLKGRERRLCLGRFVHQLQEIIQPSVVWPLAGESEYAGM
jgi:hypothetical protein